MIYIPRMSSDYLPGTVLLKKHLIFLIITILCHYTCATPLARKEF